MPEIHDIAVRNAIAQALDHDPPFSTEELAGITGPLIVRNAKNLDDLQHLTGLRELDVAGSDVTSLTPWIAPLTELESLRMMGTLLEDIQAITTCTQLRKIFLDFGRLRDLSPLLDLPQRLTGSLVAQPFDDNSFHVLRPQVQQRHNIMFSLPEYREYTCGFAKRGVNAAYDRLYGFRSCLLRLGVANDEGCLFLRTSPRFVPKILARDVLTTESLFSQPNALRSFSLSGLRICGRAEDALTWIDQASSLSDGDKTHLKRFVSRFPGQMFYRDTPAYHTFLESIARVSFPAHLKRFQQVLSWVEPEIPRWELMVQLDAESDLIGNTWYLLPSEGPPDSDHRESLIPRGLHTIGMAEGGGRWLGVQDDEADPRIYHFTDSLMWRSDEHPIPIFNSYAELLGRVVAIQRPDGTVLNARPS